jgi:hypothetical protein
MHTFAKYLGKTPFNKNIHIFKMKDRKAKQVLSKSGYQ